MNNIIILNMFRFYYIKKFLTIDGLAFFFTAIPTSIGFKWLFELLFKGAEMKDIVLPIIAIISTWLLYILFFFIDFVYGLIASRHEFRKEIKLGNESKDNDWVKSNRLYDSFGKLLGITLIDVLLLIIILLLVATEYNKTSSFILLFSIFANVMASLFEFHSIGENIKRRFNKKPPIFKFFDKVTSALEGSIIKKIHNLFSNNYQNDFEEDNDFENSQEGN